MNDKALNFVKNALEQRALFKMKKMKFSYDKTSNYLQKLSLSIPINIFMGNNEWKMKEENKLVL